MPTSPAVDWLLSSSEPSIRYRTLTELLDAGGTDAARESRRLVAQSAEVGSILGRMHPDGYWLQRASSGRMVGDGVEYGPMATTHFCLAYLAELGMDRGDVRVARAADRYLDLQCADGDFWRHMSCLYAYNIRTFVMLGYRDDPRVRRAVELMRRTDRADGGYLCDLHEGKRSRRPVKSCARGSAKALMAYAVLPKLWNSPRCLRLVDYFLAHNGIFRTDDPRVPVVREAERTVFPYTWACGLLDVLLPLSIMGYGQRSELDRAWSVLTDKRDQDGRYRLDWTPTQTLLKFGKRGAPNRWVTLYALLAEKHRDASGPRRARD